MLNYLELQMRVQYAGLFTIANIEFGILANNTNIKARLFNYDYSETEIEFSKKEDRDQLKREIEENLHIIKMHMTSCI